MRTDRGQSIKKAKRGYTAAAVHTYIPVHNMKLWGLSALCCAAVVSL